MIIHFRATFIVLQKLTSLNVVTKWNLTVKITVTNFRGLNPGSGKRIFFLFFRVWGPVLGPTLPSVQWEQDRASKRTKQEDVLYAHSWICLLYTCWGTVVAYWDGVKATDWTVRGSNVSRGRRFLSYPERPDWFWGPSNLLFNGYRIFLRDKAVGTWS